MISGLYWKSKYLIVLHAHLSGGEPIDRLGQALHFIPVKTSLQEHWPVTWLHGVSVYDVSAVHGQAKG